MSGARLATTATISCGILGIAIALGAVGCSLNHSTAKTPEERWKEDLNHFAAELPARHADFFQITSEEAFARDIAETRKALPGLSDSEVVLRLMRQVAGLRIGHTRVDWPSGPLAFHRYPIHFHWFPEGLVVIGASSEYREAVGCLVQKFGAHTPEAVESGVSAFIPFENEMGLKDESPTFMRVSELLQHLGIAGADGRLRLTLERTDGAQFDLEVMPASNGTQSELVTIWDTMRVPSGLARKHLDAHYWHEYLPEAKALFVQYNVCRDMPGQPFEDYVTGLFAFVDAHAVERVVVDLRRNGGGSSRLVKPLIAALKSRPALSDRGRCYALIGRRTVSSGMFAALDLRNECNAILVGEPTGAKPNAYGDMRTFELPNSRLVIKHSTKFFRLIENDDPPALRPDLAVPCSYEDFLAGRDPALEAALRHQAR